VQITGEYKSVENALFQVTGCLRDSQVRAKKPYIRVTEEPLRNDLVPNNIGALSSALRLQQVEIPPTTPLFAVVVAFSSFFKSIYFTPQTSLQTKILSFQKQKINIEKRENYILSPKLPPVL